MLNPLEKRLDETEAELNMAIAHIAALRAALISLIYDLGEHMPDLPARISHVLTEFDAPAIRAAGGTRAELNAAETEAFARDIQAIGSVPTAVGSNG